MARAGRGQGPGIRGFLTPSCPVRLGLCLFALTVSSIFSGCLAEVEDPDRGLPVSGTVTYRGGPVKKAAIHFLPTVVGGLPASGTIVDGEIKDVFTKTQGDGIKAGKYRIAIMSYDEAFLESTAKRDFNGPDPAEVARAAKNFKSSIPVRYNNSRESGLVAEISPGHQTIRLELVD
jgi:hypothetical protein